MRILVLRRGVGIVFLIFIALSFFAGGAQGEPLDCCCWGAWAWVNMGVEDIVCWQNGAPDPDCGWCTIGYGGYGWIFECRKDEVCDEGEVGCNYLVLIEFRDYAENWNCQFCFCDEPPMPTFGYIWEQCTEENCQSVGTTCNCDPGIERVGDVDRQGMIT